MVSRSPQGSSMGNGTKSQTNPKQATLPPATDETATRFRREQELFRRDQERTGQGATRPAKARRETWLDWLPVGTPEPDELLTRAQFLDRLRQRGVDVTESTLLHWERTGALPRAVRRWRGRTPATWYPVWLVPLAARIPGLQADGLELREIGPRLRTHVAAGATMSAGAGQATATGQPGSLAAGATMSARAGTAAAGAGGTTTVADHATEDDIAPAFLALALRYERITGSRVVRIEGRITDADGRTVEYVTTVKHEYLPATDDAG